MIAVLSPRGFTSALALAALVAIGCHAVAGVDYEITQASSGGASPIGPTGATTDTTSNVASTTAGPASTSASASEAQSSSSGPIGECVAPLFHVTFDENDPATWDVLHQSGPGDQTSALKRAGEGAWQIALEVGESRGSMQWSAVEKGKEYWMGFSYLHQGPNITDGTRPFSILCSYGAPDYQETMGFSFEMAKLTPNFPFRSDGLARDLVASTQDGIDLMDTLQETMGTWTDWAMHFKVSTDADGFFEVFHEDTSGVMQKVFRAEGQLVDEMCEPTVFIRWGLARWQADLPAQTALIDEIRVLRVPVNDPPSELDYLHTLDPDSGCGDAAP